MWHLAELNVARLVQPLDHDRNSEFVAALEPINALAESAPGFVWRLQTPDGSSSTYVDVPGVDDPQLIINFSIWADVESLRHYVTRSGHSAYLRRRREWFERAEAPSVVCWWLPVGDRPPIEDGLQRLEHLRTHGPSEIGWDLHNPMPAPGS